jgi:hypothetical protein
VERAAPGVGDRGLRCERKVMGLPRAEERGKLERNRVGVMEEGRAEGEGQIPAGGREPGNALGAKSPSSRSLDQSSGGWRDQTLLTHFLCLHRKGERCRSS